MTNPIKTSAPMVAKAFTYVAVSLVAYTGAGVAGLVLEKPMFDAPDRQSAMTAQMQDNLRAELDGVLSGLSTKTILWGESDHTDFGQLEFLADAATLKLLSAKGVDRVFVEYAPSVQENIDAVARHPNSALFKIEVADSGNAKGVRRDALMTRLIRNAALQEIKVYAGDANRTWATIPLSINSKIMLGQAALLKHVSSDVAESWMTLGQRWLAMNRLQDQATAKFVEEHPSAKGGAALIYRGNMHVQNDLDTGLRRLMPDAVSMAYSFTTTSEWQRQKALCQEGYGYGRLGEPSRATNYVIDLNSATIKKCVQPGGVS